MPAVEVIVLGGILAALIITIAYQSRSSSSTTVNTYSSFSNSHNPTPQRNTSNSVNSNKITYDRRTPIRSTNTSSKLFKGQFEGTIDVAVKKTHVPTGNRAIIRTDLDSLQERLRREVDINHNLVRDGSMTNIVRFFCYEFEKDNGKLFLLLALEQCDCNLDEYVLSRHTSTYPPTSNSDIISQILRGLHFLHSRQIVHRDLKPSNILIKQSGNEDTLFKLSDFELSKLNTLSNNGDPTEKSYLSDEYGTVHWIPPEIFALREKSVPNPDRSYWKRSDIFPLGLIFHFVETDGQYVFTTQDDIQSGNANFTHISGNYTMLQLLRRMLAPRPEKRPFTEDIMKHPVMWTNDKILDFFDNTSNLLMDPTIALKSQIEHNAVNVLGGNWQVHLTSAVENRLFLTTNAFNRRNRQQNQPSYNRTSVQSLLRAIRNNKGHFYQLNQAVRTEFGSFPDGYCNYWSRKFPQLLMHTYDAMKVHSTESCMMKFYS